MGEGGKRGEVDAKINAWERKLERLRVALAGAPEAVHAAHHQRFVGLYRQKEIVKSRWEVLRGTYQPNPEAVAAFEQALAAMDAAWANAAPMLAEVLPVRKVVSLAALLLLVAGLLAGSASATEYIFLQDGRVIQADKAEIIGDQLRITKPTETIDVPRSAVSSIHSSTPPNPSAGPSAPAEVYRDMTQQMNDKLRREIEGRPTGVGAR